MSLDSPELAAQLVQFVGLISLYVNEQRHIASEKRISFTNWALERRIEQLIALNAQQPALFEALQIAIQNDIQGMADSIDQLNRNIAAILVHLPGLDQIKTSIPPESILHESAISILRLWVHSNHVHLVVYRGDGGPVIQLEGGEGLETSVIRGTDPRFVHDDLDSLVALGLILPGATGSGLPKYQLTRAAEEFIRRLDAKNARSGLHE